MYLSLVFYIVILGDNVFSQSVVNMQNVKGKALADHTMVTESELFPYVVAILKKSSYLCAGALIDNSWILTGGDALFLLRESAREIRVRLGSINYKKGGVLMPIKEFEIHPYFRDTKPEYDIALIQLSKPVHLKPNLHPIGIQKKPKEITATHFIVTAWPVSIEKNSKEPQKLESMETIKRRRILTISHLHPTDPDQCMEELEGLDINSTTTLMCLDQPVENPPCARDIGAPVVLNGMLWGIISSYKPEDCDVERAPSFVTLVSSPGISSWIHAGIRGHKWTKSPFRVVLEKDIDDEYDNDDDDDYNNEGED